MFGKKKKNTKEEQASASTGVEIPNDINLVHQTAQDCVPFEDIDSSMICLPGHLYRMVVEVGSLNYELKTEEERNIIEEQFRMAVGSWDFPFMLYTQTREINVKEITEILTQDIEDTRRRYPTLVNYGQNFMLSMRDMSRYKGNNLMKRHFVIINCDDAGTIKANKTENDCREYAFNKLATSVNKVRQSLESMQLETHCLDNEELAEMLFTAINKSEGEKAKAISEFMSETVSVSPREDKLDLSRLELLFKGFENQLQMELMRSHEYSQEDFSKMQDLLNKVDHWKNDVLHGELSKANDNFFDLSM